MHPTPADPFDLERFVVAQADVYTHALAELEAGEKRTHWIWYIFPQLAGLGKSERAIRFALGGLDEARAYLAHPILGPRLRTCAEAVLAVPGRSARDIVGYDDVKLRSSATLFALVSPPGSVFQGVLDRFFHGTPDERTNAHLAGQS